jgi:hypothetical protein
MRGAENYGSCQMAGKYRLEGGKYDVQDETLFISSLVSCDPQKGWNEEELTHADIAPKK